MRRDESGAVLLDSRAARIDLAAQAVWSAALEPHTLENVGTRELRAIAVEQKNGASE